MNAQRKPAPKAAPPAGSGLRRKAPAAVDSELSESHHETESDPELEERVFMLVTRVSQDEGLVLPASLAWLAAADAAKRRGYIEEKGMKLFLRSYGKQWLAVRANPDEKAADMIKSFKRDKLMLKDLSRETGVQMQDALGAILRAVYNNRDELTRFARRNNLEHPWEAIDLLARKL